MSLAVREDAVPKFCKLRIIPFALKPLVGAELDRLLAEGVIEKINYSEWASPMVVVNQGKDPIWVNPVIKTDVLYLMPLPEELFHKLN